MAVGDEQWRREMRRLLRTQARRRLDRAIRQDELSGADPDSSDAGVGADAATAEGARKGVGRHSRRTRTSRTERTDVRRDGDQTPPCSPLAAHTVDLESSDPYCFTIRRMRRSWREADRRADREGEPVDLTIGATRARQHWYDLIYIVVEHGALVRVRNAKYDEPVIVMSESRFRRLERAARAARDPSPEPERRSTSTESEL